MNLSGDEARIVGCVHTEITTGKKGSRKLGMKVAKLSPKNKVKFVKT